MAGTYMDITFSEASEAKLDEILKEFGLKKDFKDEYHCTITYSKKPLPELTTFNDVAQDEEGNASDPLEKVAQIKGFGHFDTDEGKNLHVELDSSWCEEEFQRAIEAGATTDYPEYKAHVTLMYNCGDFTYSNKLGQQFIGNDIEIVEQRISPLNENWVDEKTDTDNDVEDLQESIMEASMFGSMAGSILLELDEVNSSPVDAIMEGAEYGAYVEIHLHDM